MEFYLWDCENERKRSKEYLYYNHYPSVKPLSSNTIGKIRIHSFNVLFISLKLQNCHKQ